MTALSEQDQTLLEFEKGIWRHQGAKDEAVLTIFGLSPVRYQQRILALIDRPEAYLHDPPLVKRLRRLRDTRRAQRTA